MDNHREEVAAVSQTARAFLPHEFINQLEGYFFQEPLIVLGLLWAMSNTAGASRSEAGQRWKEIATNLAKARKEAPLLGN